MLQLLPDGGGCISDLIDQLLQLLPGNAEFMCPAFHLGGHVLFLRHPLLPLRRNVIEAETPISNLVRDAAHGWMLPVLDLDPVIAPTAAVGALAMLRDQTFKPHAAGRLEQLRPNLALLEWRHEDPLGPPAEQLRQVRLAQVQRQSAEVSPSYARQSKA
jgi:hypothetical protein